MIVWCSGGGEAGAHREGGAAALEVHPHRWQEGPATVIDAPLPPPHQLHRGNAEIFMAVWGKGFRSGGVGV